MLKELGRHLADAFAAELRLPDQLRPSREIEGHLGQGFVHGQEKTVALHAALVAHGLTQRLAEGESGIFYGVVLVDAQVAAGLELEVAAGVFGEKIEHVIEKSDAGADLAVAAAVEIDADADLGLASTARDLSPPRRILEIAIDRLPIGGDQVGVGLQPLAQQDGLAAEVAGEQDIADAVPDHKGIGQVVITLHIAEQHGGAGLARRGQLVREGMIDMDRGEMDALPGQGLEDKILHRPEALFGEGGRAQAILVGDHHQLEGALARDPGQRGDGARDELELGKGVDLFIRGLADEGAITVDKKESFHACSSSLPQIPPADVLMFPAKSALLAPVRAGLMLKPNQALLAPVRTGLILFPGNAAPPGVCGSPPGCRW